MPYVLIEDQFHSNPKVIDAGLDGSGLYARALSFCAAYLTDGYVAAASMLMLAERRRKVIAKCVEVGLFVAEGDGYRIPDYLDYNPSRAEVEARREERAKAGRKGARQRWQTDSNSHGTSHSSSHGEPMATAIAKSSKSHGKTMARGRAAPAPSPTPAPNGLRSSPDSSKGSRGTSVSPAPEKSKEPNTETQRAIHRLAEACKGTDSTTERVITAMYAGKLPPAAFESARESTLERNDPHISYAMGTLRAMLAEGQYA